jgi:hypothetical protein
MATTTELQRVQDLIARLLPLSRVERGELIRAEDWNEVVGALIDIARALLGQRSETTVPPHEHVNQVSAAWLDPRLRVLVERGTLSDPAAEGKLGDLDRRIERLGLRTDTVTDSLDEVRRRVLDVDARDVVRQADLNSTRRTVEGLSDANDDVLQLRETIKTIETDVKANADLRSRLTVNGQPIDVGGIVEKLKGLDELRARLTRPSGELLDAATIGNRLDQIAGSAITQQQLEDALKNRRVEIPAGQLTSLEDRLRNDLSAALDTRTSQLGDGIRAEFNARFAGVDAQVSRAVADATPGLTASVLNSLRPELSAVVTRSADDSRTAFDKKLGDTADALRRDLGAKVSDTQQSIGNAVRAELDRQLSTSLESLKRNLSALAAQVAPFAARIDATDALARDLGTRFESFSRQSDANLNTLRQSLANEIARRDQQLHSELDDRFSKFDTTSRERLDAATATITNNVLDAARQAATAAAAIEAGLVESRLRGEIHAVARDEVLASRNEFRAVVNQQVTDAFRAVPGIVSDEVRRATSNLPDLVKTEVEVRNRIDRTGGGVRGGDVIRIGRAAGGAVEER